jgi:glucose-1-phosphate thymidylyltransferase
MLGCAHSFLTDDFVQNFVRVLHGFCADSACELRCNSRKNRILQAVRFFSFSVRALFQFFFLFSPLLLLPHLPPHSSQLVVAQHSPHSSSMRAIIPVAGVGSRLRPHTYTLPKVLLNVAGKPILGHILDELVRQGIRECTIITGYLRELVEDYVRSNYDLKFDFIQQDQLHGLGHAIWLARETFGTEPMLVILGDTIFEVALETVIGSATSSLGVKEVEDPRRFGVVECAPDGMITRLVEKPEVPQTNLALVGLYYIKNPQLLASSLERLIASDIRTRGEYQLTDALQMMIDQGEPFTTFAVEGWHDCGKPETLLSTNRYLLDRKTTSRALDDSIIIPPVYIDPSAVVKRSVVGPYATIAAHSTVKNSIVRDSIISNYALVEQSMLAESIVGNNAQVKGNFRRINVGDSSEVDFSSSTQ